MDWYKHTAKKGWPDTSAEIQAREGNNICKNFRNGHKETKCLHAFRTMNKSIILVDYSKDFYYIDTGPFRGGQKGHGSGNKHHRIVKNGFHITNHKTPKEIYNLVGKEYPNTQFERYFHCKFKQWSPPKQRKGKNILICDDNHISILRCFGRARCAPRAWSENIATQIKKIYPDANIKFRKKPTPSERRSNEWELNAQIIREDIGVVVTLSSFVGLHALMLGVPAIMLGPSEADYLSSKSLLDVKNPKYPTPEEFKDHMMWLACNQWSHDELRNGTAWKYLKLLQGENVWNPNTCLSTFYPFSKSVSWKYEKINEL